MFCRFVFFFKQKTAYEMRISDWSSDVCSADLAWLLTGQGDMQIKGGPPGLRKLPFYDSGFEEIGILAEGKTSLDPLYYIEVPTLSGADFATICHGNSMEPDIPAGAVITLKEIDTAAMLPGEIYLVVTSSYSTVKSVMDAAGDPGKYRLIPKNGEEYGETLIPKTEVRRLFLVKGIVSTRVL